MSDTEFDQYHKWNLAKNQEIVGKRQDVQAKNQEIVGKRQDVQAKNQEIVGKRQDVQAKNQMELKGLQQDEAQLIVEYQRMIINFTQLHKHGSTSSTYFDLKATLKKALLKGKPPEILPQLEPLRFILMQ